jgi:RNA polymerase-associated protein LEO1
MRHSLNPSLTICSEPLRTLEDDELDSGDDEGRRDRMPSEQYDHETQNVVIQESSMSRQPLPEPTDGEVCLVIPQLGSLTDMARCT